MLRIDNDTFFEWYTSANGFDVEHLSHPDRAKTGCGLPLRWTRNFIKHARTIRCATCQHVMGV